MGNLFDIYGAAMVISLITCTLLLSIWRLIKVRYGRVVMTHFTALPYKLSFLSLLFHLFNSIGCNVNYYANGKSGVEQPSIVVIVQLCLLVKEVCFLLFMDVLIFELIILKSFIDFQDVFDTAHLEIAKEKYNKRERSLKKINRVIVLVCCVVMSVVTIVRCVSPGFRSQIVRQMTFLFFELNIGMLYFWANVTLFYTM